MKTYNNEIVVRRNETFSIDKYIVNRDGSPYIVSSRIENPYFLLTVTSSKYEQTDRYVLNKWLNISTTPRFYTTNAVKLEYSTEEYDVLHPGEDGVLPSWEDNYLPSGYEGDRLLPYANAAVFYIEDAAGNRSYCYFVYTDEDDGEDYGEGDVRKNYDGKWVPYSCRLVTSFQKGITSNWIEQNYTYGILLVGGEYNTPSEPIVTFDTVITILEPTKLTVLSNLKGGM